MQTNKKSIALHFNNSKKVVQLVKRICHFQANLSDHDFQKRHIIEQFYEQFNKIVENYTKKMDGISVESQEKIISPSLTEQFQKQYSNLQVPITKIQKQFDNSVLQISKKINAQNEAVKKISQKLDELFSQIEHDFTVEKFDEIFQSRITRILKAQADEILAIDQKSNNELQALQQQSDQNCHNIEQSYMEKMKENHQFHGIDKAKDELTKLLVLLPTFSTQIQEIQANFAKSKEQLVKKYQPVMEEIKLFQIRCKNDKMKLEKSFSLKKDTSLIQKQQSLKAKQAKELSSLECSKLDKSVIFDHQSQILTFKINFQKLLQEFISDYTNEYKNFADQKENQKRLMNVENAKNEVEKLKKDHLLLQEQYSNKLQSIKQINPKSQKGNDQIKRSRQEFDTEFQTQTQICQKRILQLQNSLEEKEQVLLKSIQESSEVSLALQTINALEKEFQSLEKEYQSLENSNQTVGQNCSDDISNKKPDSQDNSKKKKSGKKTKNAKNSAKSNDPTNSGTQGQKPNNNLKSLERELKSLENAKQSAIKLAETKRKEFLDEKMHEINQEKERSNIRLMEIGKHSKELEEQVQLLKNQLMESQDERRKIETIASDFSELKIQSVELLDSARQDSSRNFVELHEKYQKELDRISQEKKNIEKQKAKTSRSFLQEKKQLELQLKNVKLTQQKSLKECKSIGNSKLSVLKVEHLEGLEDLQVEFISQKNTARKQYETYEEELQMKKSIKELNLKDTEKQLKKALMSEKTKLMGIRGFYEERESVVRQKLQKMKERYEGSQSHICSDKIRAYEIKAEKCGEQLSELLRELSKTKSMLQKQDAE